MSLVVEGCRTRGCGMMSLVVEGCRTRVCVMMSLVVEGCSTRVCVCVCVCHSFQSACVQLSACVLVADNYSRKRVYLCASGSAAVCMYTLLLSSIYEHINVLCVCACVCVCVC